MPFEIALQLYTVRSELEKGFLDGLARVAEAGFTSVEFAGFGDANSESVGARLNELGMTAAGAHVSLSVLDDPAAVVSDLKTIGCTIATLPWVPEEMRHDWSETAKRLDETALRLGDEGIDFSYHNHDFEFINNGYASLTANAVRTKFQLDVYWAEKAGESAVGWINKLGTKLSSLHCKDLAEDGGDIEIGYGVLKWHDILAAVNRVGAKLLVLEMDNPRMEPMESARVCLENMERILISFQQSQT
jgi:sugar phosphate isomerase/epimerase